MQEDLDAPARKRTHNLAHDLVEKLTQSILLGQMSPGDKLPSENSIVQEHGVSRTVVREAISKLQASGLVETRHGIGTFVIERAAEQGLRLNVDTALGVRSILELRMGLETQAAALAAQRRSDAVSSSCCRCVRRWMTISGCWPTTTVAWRPIDVFIC